MHEYRNSFIAKLMRNIAGETPGQFTEVSEENLRIAFETLERLPNARQDRFTQLLVLGAHESPIASALGAMGYWVMGVCFRPAFLGLQNRQRRVAFSKARFIKSTYEDLGFFVVMDFDAIVILQDVDFAKVKDLCLKRLRKGGAIVVAQNAPCETDDEDAIHLKKTSAGYCIEAKRVEDAGWAVFSVSHATD